MELLPITSDVRAVDAVAYAPLTLAGGAGGGPVAASPSVAEENSPSPNPSHKCEGESRVDPTLAGEAAKSFFTPERQVRFLDALAGCGNVRVSARRAGVSHETAYRQRRRDAEFAALWDAALVHARERVAAIAGDRAIDGVMEEVWFRGELVGHRRRYDARLLLAHLARLDKLVEDGDAAERARGFDAGLAELAGHAAPEGFAEAYLAAQDWRDRDPAMESGYKACPPPTLGAFVAWYCEQAVTGLRRKQADARWQEAHAEAETIWFDWLHGHRAAVDAVLGLPGEGCEAPLPPTGGGETRESPLPPAGGAGGGPVLSDAPDTPTPDRCSSGTPSVPRKREGDEQDPPIEVKSAPRHSSPWTVSQVSTPCHAGGKPYGFVTERPRRRARSAAEGPCGRLAHSGREMP